MTHGHVDAGRDRSWDRSLLLAPDDIPTDFPVRPVWATGPTGTLAEVATDPVTCGTCGLSWDDAVSTAYTPAPSARCPFEAFHKPESKLLPQDPASMRRYLELRMTPAPVCKVCDDRGHLVETVTNTVHWHHEDPAVEEDHDFEPDDGRPTFMYSGPVDTAEELADILAYQVVGHETSTPVKVESDGNLWTEPLLELRYDKDDGPCLFITVEDKGPSATALDAIVALLDGVEWETSYLDDIAAIIKATGREISEYESGTEPPGLE